MSGLTAPRVFAAPGKHKLDATSPTNVTVIASVGAVVLNVGSVLPSMIDSRLVSFDVSGCASRADGSVACAGLEHGQLGASNACSASNVSTSTLTLP